MEVGRPAGGESPNVCDGYRGHAFGASSTVAFWKRFVRVINLIQNIGMSVYRVLVAVLADHTM